MFSKRVLLLRNINQESFVIASFFVCDEVDEGGVGDMGCTIEG